MLLFIDEKGEQYSALADLKETKGVNGEKSISGTIYSNDYIIENIGRGWKIKFNDEIYCLTYASPVDEGIRNEVEFDAVHEFFFNMQKSVVYSTLNGSNTMKAYLDFIFNGSGYTYRLEVNVSAFEKQNFGMKNRLELFKDIIKSTKLEFSVNGKIVRIIEKVGTDLSTIVIKGFNLNELKIEKDINSFITYVRGYGAYLDEEDQTKGRIEAEYLSPLAEIYGKLEGDPISDERYTVVDNLTRRLEDEVNNSYGISVSLNMEDLVSAGYEYERPHEGDYIMAINDDLHFRNRIRIVSYSTFYDVNGNIIDHEVTAGSDTLVDKSRGGHNDRLNNIESDLNAAIGNSNSALITADGKNTVYYGPDMPTGDLKTGDIWYQTIGEETVMKFWNGFEWQLFFDPAANEKDIDDAQTSADEAKRAAEQAYIDSTQKAQEAVDAASNDWDTKLSNTKNDFNEGLTEANSKIDSAQTKANSAFQEAIDAQTNASDAHQEALNAQESAKDAHQAALEAANKSDENTEGILKISTDLGKLQMTVTGPDGVTSQITQQSNQITSLIEDVSGNSSSIVQLDSQISSTVKDVSGNKSSIIQLHDQITTVVEDVEGNKSSIVQLDNQLSTVVEDISGNKSSIIQLSNQISTLVEDVEGNSSNITQLSDQISAVISDVSGNKSSITQLSDDLSLKVSKGDVVSSINLSPELIRISGKKIQLDGDVLINQAWIANLYADNGFITNLETKTINSISANITSIITDHLASNSISSEMIKVETGLIDKLFATSALIEQLTSKTAFINSIQAIDISADRIKTGTLDATEINIINLNADSIVSGTLTAISITGGDIAGSTITGGAISGTTINGGEITGTTIDGTEITGGTIEGATIKSWGMNGNYPRTRIDLDEGYVWLFNTNFDCLGSLGVFIKNQSNFAGDAGGMFQQQGHEFYMGVSREGAVPTSDTVNPLIHFPADNKVYSNGGTNYMNVYAKTTFLNAMSVTGSKNAIHPTRYGVVATPAYELAESYLGDIGRNYTDQNCEMWVKIEEVFLDTVNTDIAYEVFLQAYDDARFWVSDFKSDAFLVRSDKPMARFAYEIKAKRRGFEMDRLVYQAEFDNEKIDESWRNV